MAEQSAFVIVVVIIITVVVVVVVAAAVFLQQRRRDKCWIQVKVAVAPRRASSVLLSVHRNRMDSTGTGSPRRPPPLSHSS